MRREALLTSVVVFSFLACASSDSETGSPFSASAVVGSESETGTGSASAEGADPSGSPGPEGTTGADPSTSSTTAGPGEVTETTSDSDSGGVPQGPGTPENPGADCVIPALNEDFDALPEYEKLHDPFTRLDGSRVTTKEQWICRRQEISKLFQLWEFGEKPDKPASVTGSRSGNGLTVNVSDGAGAQLSFSVNITYPNGGTGPYPALIGLAGGNLPQQTFTNLGVAVINFNHDQMGNQSGMRGAGQFFQFNGDVDAGALLAWAWGVSRIIDALEVTPDANIDPTHLAVNGCSRNGKGTLAIGALDARIALTIPQESGAGGAGAWRVLQADRAAGVDVQTLESAAGEQPWFRENFSWFGAYVNKLPVDHHQLLGMVAPRGLLVIGNPNFNWLGLNAGDQSVAAARLIYEAFGVPNNIGQVESGHNHCDFPQSEVPALQAFIRKFLLEEDVDTNYWVVLNAFDRARWVDWEAPVLE